MEEEEDLQCAAAVSYKKKGRWTFAFILRQMCFPSQSLLVRRTETHNSTSSSKFNTSSDRTTTNNHLPRIKKLHEIKNVDRSIWCTSCECADKMQTEKQVKIHEYRPLLVGIPPVFKIQLPSLIKSHFLIYTFCFRVCLTGSLSPPPPLHSWVGECKWS